MKDFTVIDAKMSLCSNLLQRWQDSLILEQPDLEPLEELKRQLGDLPSGLSDLHRQFFHNLAQQIEVQPAAAVPEAVPRRLPLRNQGEDIPGRLEVHRERDGLIHGATVALEGSALVCKAYLYFMVESTNLWNHYVAWQVAGVVEQFDATGSRTQIWSTNRFERMEPYYDSTGHQFMAGCCEVKENFPRSVLVHGHYMPEEGVEGELGSAPSSTYHNEKGLFTEPPDVRVAPENPLYDPPHSAAGYQLATPLIKIFAPQGASGAIVTMIGAGRSYDIRIKIGGADKRFRRVARFDSRTFI